MTTKNSPTAVLRAQAEEIARLIKEAERGNPVAPEFKRRFEEARRRDEFKAGVVMDDKTIILTLPWTVIKAHSRDELCEWILAAMQERRETIN